MNEKKEENFTEAKVRSSRRTNRTVRSKNHYKTEKKNTPVKNSETQKSEDKPKTTRRGRKKTQSIQSQENKSLSIKQNNSLNAVPTEKKEEDFRFKKSKLKIIPLGGLHEIGKNITVFAYEDEMIVVDCGLSFPDDDMLGVDIVIPDIAYIVRNQEKLKGMVITHGHEDHIGGIPYFLKQVNTPIYGTKLTLGLIKNKLEEHNLEDSTELNEVNPGETVKLGKYFKVEFIQSSHSIPDSVMFAITTPVGTVVHTGDFKVDFTPMDGKLMDFSRLAELGSKGVLALMSDSTNSERKGITMSESTVGDVFEKLFNNCTKRIVVATFASNVHRVQQIVNCAVKYGRKIAVCGRSMVNMITTARELGYIDCPDNLFIEIDMISNYTDDKLLIITTGSQGETMSALTRMASGTHRKVKITPNDLVIISASPIPGNEKSVSKVIDSLMQIGAEVVYSALEDVHVSGHASSEELKLIHTLIHPRFFMPVHGEHRHLVEHSVLAQSLGQHEGNIFIMNNGDALCVNGRKANAVREYTSGEDVMVDGYGVGDIGNAVLRERKNLSQSGLVTIAVALDTATGSLMAVPEMRTIGLVYEQEHKEFLDEALSIVYNTIGKSAESGALDEQSLSKAIKSDMKSFIYKTTKRSPVIIPIILYV